MAEVLLLHHSLGLTPGVVAFADQLRAAGHTVHTPDYFEGRTFGSIEAGTAYGDELGSGETREPGQADRRRVGASWSTPGSRSALSWRRCWLRPGRGPAGC